MMFNMWWWNSLLCINMKEVALLVYISVISCDKYLLDNIIKRSFKNFLLTGWKWTKSGKKNGAMETMGAFSGRASCQPMEMANINIIKWLVCLWETDVIKYSVVLKIFPYYWHLIIKKTDTEHI